MFRKSAIIGRTRTAPIAKRKEERRGLDPGGGAGRAVCVEGVSHGLSGRLAENAVYREDVVPQRNAVSVGAGAVPLKVARVHRVEEAFPDVEARVDDVATAVGEA